MAKGLYTNSEIIDTLIEDVNAGIKQICTGNYVAWSALNVQIVQKLSNLKRGIENDMKSKNDTIEALKHQLRDVGVEVEDIPADKL